MAMGIAAFAVELADLTAKFNSGELTQEQYASGLQALWEQSENIPLLFQTMQQVIDIKSEILTAWQAALGLKGTVTSVSALPAEAAERDAYKIENILDPKDGHIYARVAGVWTDIGRLTGSPGYSAYEIAVEKYDYGGTEEQYAQDPINNAVLAATAADEADSVREATDLVRTQTIAVRDAAQEVVDAGATIIAAKDTAVEAAGDAGAAQAAAEAAQGATEEVLDDATGRVFSDASLSAMFRHVLPEVASGLPFRFRLGNRLLATTDVANGFWFRRLRIPADTKVNDQAGLNLVDRILAGGVGGMFRGAPAEAGAGFRLRAGNRLIATMDAVNGLWLRRLRVPTTTKMDDQPTVNLSERVLGGAVGSWFRKLGPEVGPAQRWRLGNRLIATLDVTNGFWPRRAKLPAATKIDDQPTVNLVDRIFGAALASYFKGAGQETGVYFRVRLGNRLVFKIPRPFNGVVGMTVTRALSADNAVGANAPAANAAYLVTVYTDGGGKRQLRSMSRTSGAIVNLTTVGNNYAPVLTSDDKVVFLSDASGLEKACWISAAGGTIYPGTPSGDVDGWGDSLTEAGWPATIGAALPGRTIQNFGIGGQTSIQIAARQGGAPALLTVTGNQIPASGAVTVTAMSTRLLSTPAVSTARSMTGTLAGVPGTLDKDAASYTNPTTYSDTYTFTRTTGGSVVACPAGTPFIPDAALAGAVKTPVLWVGRNDGYPNYPSVTLPNVAAMVAYLKAFSLRYLVLGVTNKTDGTENSGSAAHTAIVAHNAALASAYGDRFFDVRLYLIASGLAAAGITPTSQDATDIANDCIPTSLMDPDGLHINTAGDAVIAARLAAIMLAKGW